jgi:hypothetical protein
MENTNLNQPASHPGKSSATPRYKWFKSSLIYVCICLVCFTVFFQSPANSSKQLSLDPEDMVQNTIYAFADHGSGMQIAKFDRMEGNNIYTFGAIRPLTLSFFGPGLWGTTADTGLIRLATLNEITQLLLSILAGVFVIL